MAENTYVVVTGKILSAPDNHPPAICRASLAEEAGSSACVGGKTIELTFHRTNPEIVMLAVTTDLARLSTDYPGWSVDKRSLVCSGTNICKEQCNLRLTYKPTQDRPESAVYLSYEYLVNGKKD